MKVFLSNIDKHLIDLALPRIFMDYGGWTTLTKAFAIVEQCDCVLCQHVATNLVSMLVDSSKFQKVAVVVVGLAEAEVDKTLYCWSVVQAGHTK